MSLADGSKIARDPVAGLPDLVIVEFDLHGCWRNRAGCAIRDHDHIAGMDQIGIGSFPPEIRIVRMIIDILPFHPVLAGDGR